MIDTIAKASPGIKGPTGYQIGNIYLEEEVQELEIYITLKARSCVMIGVLGLESLSSIS